MKNKEGFSLVELIISLAILSFVAVSLFNMLFVSAKICVASENELDSATDVQELFEEIKDSEDLQGLLSDGLEHSYLKDNTIIYTIKPVTDYDCSGKHILYEINLKKIIEGKICQNFIGTVLIK